MTKAVARIPLAEAGRTGGGCGVLRRADPGLRWGFFLFVWCLASGVLTGLQLCVSLYALAIHDRALPSGDLGALALLTVAALGLHVVFSLLDLARGRALTCAGFRLARRLERGALGLFETDRKRGLAALGDVERITHYVSTSGPPALFDAVWLPASLAVLALLHPALALFSCLGVVVLFCIASPAESRWRGASHGILEARRRRIALADRKVCRCRWRTRAFSRSYYRQYASASETALVAGAALKAARASLQTLSFGLGALLVIRGSLSIGQLFAATLIANRLFAALDAVLAHGRGFAAARESYLNLVAMGVAEEIKILRGFAASLRS